MMLNGAWYLAPTIACPGNRATTRQSWSSTRSARSSATTTLLWSGDLTATTYVASGCTATAVLETSVHGVVVHTSRSAPSSSDGAPSGTVSSGNLTVMAGSVTVW